MLLFWDGASAPTDWTIVTTYDGRFPRGEAVVNFGNTGGNATHTPTTSSVTHSAPSTERASGANTDRASSTHTHSVSVTVGPADNLPSFRSLKLIQYDNGIPNTIPSGAIAIFDDDPGIPASGWTRQSDQDNRIVRVNSSVATGGSDTHQHTLTWSAFGAGSGTARSGTNNTNVGTLETHTHTAPSATNTTGITALPPYIEVIIAKADSDTSIPAGMIAMFDADPGTGWTVRSGSGGTFYQQFIRGASTFNGTSQGTTSHTHANETSGASGAATDTTTGFGTGTGTAAAGHTHTITASFNSVDHIPEYFNVVYAEKDEDALTTFTLSNYRWYQDDDTLNPANAWGESLAANTAIVAIPSANDPPEPARELRLRDNMTVNDANLSALDRYFKLQYKQGTDATCTTGSWTDVGAGGGGIIWRYATSGVTDGTTLTISRLTSDVLQVYIKVNPSALNPNSAISGETIEYDFHIEHNGAVNASQYSFRVVETDATGTPTTELNAYTNCPTLTTRPGVENFMRHGNFYVDEVLQGFFWAD